MRIVTVFLLIGLSGLSCSTGPTLEDDEGLFRDDESGFSIVKPREWLFVSLEEQGKLPQAPMGEDVTPLVAMIKYPEPYDDVSPFIAVSLKPLDYPRPAEEWVKVLMVAWFATGNDARLDPVHSVIGGKMAPGAYLFYPHVMPDGREVQAVIHLWVINAGKKGFFIIQALRRHDESTGTREEIEEILKTVKIKRGLFGIF